MLNCCIVKLEKSGKSLVLLDTLMKKPHGKWDLFVQEAFYSSTNMYLENTMGRYTPIVVISNKALKK